MVERIQELDREIARLHARKLQEVAAYHAYRDGARDVSAELTLALSITERSAQKSIALATALTDRLPETFAAMQRGELDSYKSSKIADVTAPLSDEQAREVDALMATRIAGKNPGQLRRSAVAAVHRVDPDGAVHRARVRRADRRVELLHGDDAMATLLADLPAEVATAAYTRIDRIARTLRVDGEARTLDQLRADVLTDLLLGPSATGGTPTGLAAGQGKAEIFVYVDLETLMGLRDRPAELAGHGTIPAWIARQIAADPSSTWRRIITDPATGTPVDVGRRRYRPPAVTADYVRVRDRTCRFPGCHRPSWFTDVDHATAWGRDGRTDAAKLVGLCRRHHRLKDTPGWTYNLDPHTHRLDVHTPTGRTHTTTPPPLPTDPAPF